ncbi:hypothetical protein TERMP_00027 [Thermococcus barophilus MP]|uniref:Uncharacterized protein n=1 Tax=Thermococcus barophilus (strain DSM 11836 / MP) TaxID=391623 RepID=F0LGW6_THEBM|nr:hypothetical protein TERMP_00027 [Thermococcus barophilus MP]
MKKGFSLLLVAFVVITIFLSNTKEKASKLLWRLRTLGK